MNRAALIPAVIAAAWAVAVLAVNYGTWKLDLTAIYFAALSFAEGRSDLVYAPGPLTYLIEPPAEWVAWAEAQGVADATFTPYLYPPLWAALLAPIASRVSAQAFMDGALIAMIAATIWMVWLSYRVVAARVLSPAVWAVIGFGLIFVTAPGYMSFWFGQPQVIVSAVLLASVVALGRGRDVMAGGLLALAAAAKLSPVLLVLLFVMEGRWRALGAFAVIGAALGGLSIALTGSPLHAELLAKLALVEERILLSHIVVSLELVLYQIAELFRGGGFFDIKQAHMVMEPLWISILTRAVMLAGIGATWWVSRDMVPRLRLWMRFFALSLVLLITNPLPWVHYLILPVALLPGFFEVLDRRRAIQTVVLAALPISIPVFLVVAGLPFGSTIQLVLRMAVVIGLFVLLLRAAREHANPTPESRRRLLPPRAPSL